MTTKIALITGCSSGIGRELAARLASQNWRVYAGARRPEALQALASERLVPVQLDVNSPEQQTQCLQRIEREAGRLDLLVNNAGYGAMGPVVEMPLGEPPAVKRIGSGSRLLPLLKRALPERWLDRMLSRKFGLSGFAPQRAQSAVNPPAKESA
jgi:NAD(P)-dependent dehydrogenase (short-subunit alcohol dehydrogenase family)